LTHDTCEGGDLSILDEHGSLLYGTIIYRNTTTIYLRMPKNKKIIVMNLSKVTHTCICGTPNEQDASTVALVVEIDTDVSIDVNGLLSECSNCKHYIIRYGKYTHTHTHIINEEHRHG
jgi:hypothetical protein